MSRRAGHGICAASAAIVWLTGCGGSTSRSVLPAQAKPIGLSGARASVTVRVAIPSPSGTLAKLRRRKPLYVSRSTQGIGVSYRSSSSGSPTVPFPNPATPLATLDLSPQSANCTTQSDGSRVCALVFPALVGLDDLQFTAWDAPASNGSFALARILSASTLLNQSISPTAINTLSLTLDGIVAAVTLALTPSTLTASDNGSPQSATIAVDAQDVDGNIILGSGAFIDTNGDPLTITLAQAVVAPGSPLRTTIASTGITPAATTVPVTYLGGASSGTRFTVTTNVPIPTPPVSATLAIVPRATIAEYAVPTGSEPLGITAGPDGNLWFAEYGVGASGAVARMSTAGAVLQTTPLAGTFPEPKLITLGPDGNVWFTRRPRRIDRITSGSVVTEFTAGISSNPFGIGAGPDGNLWFTEGGSDTIGRITPAGVVTEFGSGITVGAQPEDIVAGSDGNLWFTEPGLAQIGRITPAGIVTEFAAGIAANAFPEGIASGPDGGIWFCERGGSAIGRIDPASGSVTEFHIGGDSPSEITAGPDGAMWFTQTATDRIGRIDMTGAVTQYQAGITTGGGPYGIAIGPDGNIWFTEYYGDRIGRLVF